MVWFDFEMMEVGEVDEMVDQLEVLFLSVVALSKVEIRWGRDSVGEGRSFN